MFGTTSVNEIAKSFANLKKENSWKKSVLISIGQKTLPEGILMCF